MKIFAFALREFDEQEYFEKICQENGIEYGFTSEYPSMENADLAAGCDGISIITNPMYPQILDKFHSLGVKYITTRSIGYDHIDVRYAKSLGMKIGHVTYSPDSVANYTIMLMLMACRRMDYIMKKARLQDFSLNGKIGKEISTCTVGVIGTGQIGKALIRHLSGFGCRILAYDLCETEGVRKYARYVGLNEIFQSCDIISLHVPGLSENYHMIGREEFSKMKDGVILINAARGSLIDTEDMIDAIKSGKIGYAALDTIENENGLYYLNREGQTIYNPDRAILESFPNVLVSPHMAFYTEQSVKDMVENSVRGIMNFAEGADNPFAV